MKMIKDPCFDAPMWINRYFGWEAPLDSDELNPLLGFCLLWALFEADCCAKNANKDSIQICIENFRTTNPDIYQRIVEFFRAHYFQNCTPNELDLDRFFHKGRNSDLRQIVVQAFATPTPSQKDIIHGLLLLTFRVRNNLFHGEKGKHLFSPDQMLLLDRLNRFLAQFLEDSKASKP